MAEGFEASNTNCEVILDFATELSRIYYMSLATENSIVVCGEPCGRTGPKSETIRSLVRYRLEDGQLMCSTDLRAEMNPAGIASVTFNGQNCVALSYYQRKEKKKIMFYALEDLTEVLDLDIGDDKPGIFFTPSPTTLLFVDYQHDPLKLKWMDCSVDPPQVTGVLSLYESWVRDICVIEDGNENKSQLLVGVYGKAPPFKIQAVNLKSGRIEWSIEEMNARMRVKFKPTSVTADTHGRIFVCDLGNGCIQIFSEKDGRYVGSLLKKGEQGLGFPKLIRWNKDRNILVVLYNMYHIQKLHVKVLKLT